MNGLAIVNQSALVATALDDDPGALEAIANAIDLQLADHFFNAWSFGLGPVTVAASLDAVPADIFAIILILDAPDEPDALGYHTEIAGRPVIKIFAQPIFDNGGDLTQHPLLSLSSVISHEAVETAANRYVNLFALRPDGVFVPRETADGVEDESYAIPLTNYARGSVRVSNFLLPSWFDGEASRASGAKFDQMGTRSAPFELSPGGYTVTVVAGVTGQENGDRELTKHDLARRAARGARSSKIVRALSR